MVRYIFHPCLPDSLYLYFFLKCSLFSLKEQSEDILDKGKSCWKQFVNSCDSLKNENLHIDEILGRQKGNNLRETKIFEQKFLVNFEKRYTRGNIKLSWLQVSGIVWVETYSQTDCIALPSTQSEVIQVPIYYLVLNFFFVPRSFHGFKSQSEEFFQVDLNTNLFPVNAKELGQEAGKKYKTSAKASHCI